MNRHADRRGAAGLESEGQVLQRIRIPPRSNPQQFLRWTVRRVRAHHYVGDAMDLDTHQLMLDEFQFVS